MPVVTEHHSLINALHKEGLLPDSCFAISVEDDVNEGVAIIKYHCYMTDEVLKVIGSLYERERDAST